jgi:hypothetical protein
MKRNPRRLQLAAVFLLGIVVLGSSCKRPEQNIGLELQPEEDLLSVLIVDTVTVLASTLREDSLRSDELSRQLAGNYIDPIFGSTATSFFSHIRLSSNNVDFGTVEDLEVDSIVLALRYGGEFFGGANSQEFSVHEITSDLHFDSAYYTNQLLEYDPANLVANPGEILDVHPGSYVHVGEDSLPPQLRIHLDPALAQRFLDVSGESELSDNEAFIEFFKGIYVKSVSADAGTIQFDLRDVFSKMTMYYRNVVEEDTTSFDFVLSALCGRFSHISHRYSHEAFEFSMSDSVAAGDIGQHTYVQSGAGLKTKLDFPFIRNLEQFDGISLGRAELIIPVRDSESSRYPKQDQLFLRSLNADGNLVVLPDEVTFNFDIGGAYNSIEGYYKFNITRYIQELINGDRPQNGLTVVSNNGSISNRRVVLNGPSKSDILISFSF